MTYQEYFWSATKVADLTLVDLKQMWGRNEVEFPPDSMRCIIRAINAVTKYAGTLGPMSRDPIAAIKTRRDMPVKVVEELLGNSSPAITLEIYGHLLPGTATNATAAFSRLRVPDEEAKRRDDIAMTTPYSEGSTDESMGKTTAA